ncbi:hypothetical protein H5410_032083 [Solanum commersonii]|uniref:Uncharacterized protein n=1 Tax=Solanum commersonii TaxID=4109 RepID=A0A9J5YK53_SOLCO|nr:hypothetical protein H5410_032083 [Solanum commersonii]
MIKGPRQRRFEYNATSELVKEIDFEETEVVRYLLNPRGCKNKNCAEVSCTFSVAVRQHELLAYHLAIPRRNQFV